MGQSIRIGDRWRRVSDTEARLRRARGEEVRVDAPTPPPTKPLPVKKLPDAPPSAPPVNKLADLPKLEPRMFDAAPRVPAPSDLSDEDLERLTAPKAPGGE